MIKKLIAVIVLALIVAGCAVGCNKMPELEQKTYKVTFIQSGQNNVVLWLDGEANICGIQQPFKIYDEQGNLIAEDGDLELAAYESFHDEEN